MLVRLGRPDGSVPWAGRPHEIHVRASPISLRSRSIWFIGSLVVFSALLRMTRGILPTLSTSMVDMILQRRYTEYHGACAETWTKRYLLMYRLA